MHGSKISGLEFHIVQKKHNKTKFIETPQGIKKNKNRNPNMLQLKSNQQVYTSL